jgi:hypothetical protein
MLPELHVVHATHTLKLLDKLLDALELPTLAVI